MLAVEGRQRTKASLPCLLGQQRQIRTRRYQNGNGEGGGGLSGMVVVPSGNV